MKTFLNVLYRRILYKIPLKFLLLLIAVFGILFACFSSADYLDGLTYIGNINHIDTNNFNITYGNIGYGTDNGSVCLLIKSFGGNRRLLISQGGYNSYQWRYQTNLTFSQILFVCVAYQGADQNVSLYFFNEDLGGLTFNIDFYFIPDENFSIVQGNAGYTSLQCQTEYNLIPISSVDSNYCQTNNLCPSCPSCPVGTGGYSQLYINNILHLGAPNIIMNIPDEIDWDYAYTQGGQNMNIDVVGYNVDYEKIDSIVQFQNYKPSSEDFQKIIGLLAPYTKIIVFFVFLFIVWAWIKKPFKSKKL